MFPFYSSWSFTFCDLVNSFYFRKGTEMKRKKCPYCKSFFIPHPRVGKRQKTCGKPDCRKRLKAKNNRRWRRKNPDYFQNDYHRVKTWLDEHPGYLKTYRENNTDYVKKNREAQRVRDRGKKIRLDIQAQLKEHLPEITDQTWSLPSLDIQDEISLKPLEIAFLFSTFPCLDIQVPLDSSFYLRENGSILKGGVCHVCQNHH